MNLEGKGEFFEYGIKTPWEKYILIDQNYNEKIGSGEREMNNNPPFPILMASTNNGEEEVSGEELLDYIVEGAALLGLEDNNNNNNYYYYGGNLETENPVAFLPSPTTPSASNSNVQAKKEEHNAKERERRMKLSQTFFSLRSLLPNSRRSKKRWSSTTIIDKVVVYIPTLQKEIEKMKQKKEKLIKEKDQIMMSNQNQNQINQRSSADHENEGLKFDDHNPTISIHQLCKGEVIIQICINNYQRKSINKFSSLIHKAEKEESLQIIGASTVSVSHPTLTCHLHLQMDRSLQEAADCKSILTKMVISWLR